MLGKVSHSLQYVFGGKCLLLNSSFRYVILLLLHYSLLVGRLYWVCGLRVCNRRKMALFVLVFSVEGKVYFGITVFCYIILPYQNFSSLIIREL